MIIPQIVEKIYRLLVYTGKITVFIISPTRFSNNDFLTGCIRKKWTSVIE